MYIFIGICKNKCKYGFKLADLIWIIGFLQAFNGCNTTSSFFSQEKN